jgi:hypothetical protein
VNWKFSVETPVVAALFGAPAALAQNEPAQPGYTTSTQTKPVVHHKMRPSHLRGAQLPGWLRGERVQVKAGQDRVAKSGVRKQPSS